MTDYLDTSAALSKDGVYRYALHRRWRDGGKAVTWIMLNPSTANATEDDPTIRRCVGYSKDWGADALTVVNLFPMRTPDPDVLATALRKQPEPAEIVKTNMGFIEAEAYWNRPEWTICAWGTKGTLLRRNKLVLDTLRELGAPLSMLRMTEDRHPSHPLYLPKTLTPQVWNGR